MNESRRGFDPLALAVVGGALLLLVALVAGLVYQVRSAPPAPPAPAKAASPEGPSVGERIADLTRRVAKEISDAAREDRPMKIPAAPKPPPAAKAPPAKASKPPPVPAGQALPPLPAGRTWVYRVEVDPAAWRDAKLSYRSVEQVRGISVYTEFTHATGKSNFNLGMYEAAHPSHANTRFPGFFFYAAYLDKPLQPGQRYAWSWPWQLPNGAMRSGRVKNFAARMAGWEKVGAVAAARIELALSYVEDGKVLGTTKETLWVSPEHYQVIRVVREGRTPDEGFQRIVAELIEFR